MAARRLFAAAVAALVLAAVCVSAVDEAALVVSKAKLDPAEVDTKEYFMGDQGESCDAVCRKQGLQFECNPLIETKDSSALMTALGMPCEDEARAITQYYSKWWAHDQPCYVSGHDRLKGKCIGFRSVPRSVNCAAAHGATRRLCRCTKKERGLRFRSHHQMNDCPGGNCFIRSPKSCSATGDPHYTTFDGRYFDWYAKGEFILYKSDMWDEQIDSRLSKRWPWDPVALHTGIAFQQGSDVVSYRLINPQRYHYPLGYQPEFKINGVRHYLPYNQRRIFQVGNLHVNVAFNYGYGHGFFVHNLQSGTQVHIYMYDWTHIRYFNAFVYVTGFWRRRDGVADSRGLCGTYDHQFWNDHITLKGDYIERAYNRPAIFGASYNVPPQLSLFSRGVMPAKHKYKAKAGKRLRSGDFIYLKREGNYVTCTNRLCRLGNKDDNAVLQIRKVTGSGANLPFFASETTYLSDGDLVVLTVPVLGEMGLRAINCANAGACQMHTWSDAHRRNNAHWGSPHRIRKEGGGGIHEKERIWFDLAQGSFTNRQPNWVIRCDTSSCVRKHEATPSDAFFVASSALPKGTVKSGDQVYLKSGEKYATCKKADTPNCKMDEWESAEFQAIQIRKALPGENGVRGYPTFTPHGQPVRAGDVVVLSMPGQGHKGLLAIDCGAAGSDCALHVWGDNVRQSAHWGTPVVIQKAGGGFVFPGDNVWFTHLSGSMSSNFLANNVMNCDAVKCSHLVSRTPSSAALQIQKATPRLARKKPKKPKTVVKVELKLIKKGPRALVKSVKRYNSILEKCKKAYATFKGSKVDRRTAIRACVTDGAVIGPKVIVKQTKENQQHVKKGKLLPRPSFCHAYSAGHYRTFDKRPYNWKDYGEYILYHSRHFQERVDVLLDSPESGYPASFHTGVGLKIRAHTVALQYTNPRVRWQLSLLMDGKPRAIVPAVYESGAIRVQILGTPSSLRNTGKDFMLMTNKYNDSEMYTAVKLWSAPVKRWASNSHRMMHWMDVRVFVKGQWSTEKTFGLCGWFDGNPKNDFRRRDSKIVHSGPKMAATWTATPEERLLASRRKPMSAHERRKLVRWAKKKGRAWLRSLSSRSHESLSTITARWTQCMKTCKATLPKAKNKVVDGCARDCMLGVKTNLGSFKEEKRPRTVPEPTQCSRNPECRVEAYLIGYRQARLDYTEAVVTNSKWENMNGFYQWWKKGFREASLCDVHDAELDEHSQKSEK